MIDFARASGKAVIVSCGVPIAPEIRGALSDGGIAVLDDPELCLRGLGRIVGCANGPPAGGPLAHPTKTIRVSIDDDRDFGLVLALDAGMGARVVRALPASSRDLHDAVEEIGAPPSAALVEELQNFAAATAPGAEATLEVSPRPTP